MPPHKSSPSSQMSRAFPLALVAFALIQILWIETSAADRVGVIASGSQRTRSPRKRSDGNETTLLHEREFVSPQVRIQVDCKQDETTIRANFSRPFNGILSAGSLASTKCKLTGAGEQYYELRVPHNASDSCDARWDNSTSSISNTLVIRFHQTLETGADIAKNVLCRLAVGNLVVGRRPNQLKKAPRTLRSPIIRDRP